MNDLSPRRRFVTSDPDGQAGLVRDARGLIPVDYVNGYNIGERVRCAFCESRTPHSRGVTALLSDGRLALCGRCCASLMFPDRDKKLWEQLQERQRDAIARELLWPLISGTPETLSIIRDWLKYEKDVVTTVSCIAIFFHSERLIQRASESGRLVITVTGKKEVQVNGILVMAASERHLYKGGCI